MTPPAPALPVLDHADAIRRALHDHGRLILAAPPGTGKSTQVPQLLLPDTGLAVVLQPRRIAARNLALRVAAERGEAPGGTVGYQVRFEQARGPATRVLFQTYGVFWQQLLRDPALPGVSLVILDEFHERALACDAALAWVKRLRAGPRPDLGVVVMSATLEVAALRAYLDDPPFLEIDARPHPVSLEYVPPKRGEPVWEAAVRGFRHLTATGLQGSVLVFMPGVGEIRRTADALDAAARPLGYRVLELHGAQRAEDQQHALSRPAEEPCVVVATNVAETSLTIPGVVAVVDSGLSRQAAYDAERDLDTLHLGWISRQNMTQRAGRAGRLGPGRCVRLWAQSLESSLAEALPPEIARLDLSRLALDVAALPGAGWAAHDWLTPPPADRWAKARERLAALAALDPAGQITQLGRQLLRYPLPPTLAHVLHAAQAAGVATLASAMIAIMEAADRRDLTDEGDLYLLGLDLVRGHCGDPQPRRGRGPASKDCWGREVVETWRQLQRLATPSDADRQAAEAVHPAGSPAEAARRETVSRCWLEAWSHRLATRQDKAYALADGRKGTVSAGRPESAMLLALQLHEVAGAAGRQATIPIFLPVEPAWTGGAEESELVVGWDAARQKVVQERHWKSGGLVVRKEPLPPAQWDRDAAEALIAARLLAGEAKLAARDEDVEQLVLRIRLAAGVWPEMGIPVLDASDWELLYHELARGKAGPDEITKDALIQVLREYVGWAAMDRIDRGAPRTWKLPGGRNARITYFEDAPPELSARLGDMIGLTGTLALFESKVMVCFNILGPNYRSVQRTFDMSGFWDCTYLSVKKELKRRYPRHPWP